MNGGIMYEQKDIVLLPFPYSDLTGSKKRPRQPFGPVTCPGGATRPNCDSFEERYGNLAPVYMVCTPHPGNRGHRRHGPLAGPAGLRILAFSLAHLDLTSFCVLFCRFPGGCPGHASAGGGQDSEARGK